MSRWGTSVRPNGCTRRWANKVVGGRCVASVPGGAFIVVKPSTRYAETVVCNPGFGGPADLVVVPGAPKGARPSHRRGWRSVD